MKREIFHLTSLEPNMVAQNAYPDLSAQKVFTELYRFHVPIDWKFDFSPSDIFSLLALKLALQPVDGAISDDGGVQTNESKGANDATVNDMILTPATPAVDDAYYIGLRFPFTGFTIKYSTAAIAGCTHAVEYCNGSNWIAIPGLVDPTSAFTAVAGTYNITWTRPKGWAQIAVNGVTLFWIRCRVTSVPATPTGASGDQAWIHPSNTALDNDDLVSVEIRSADELVKIPLIKQITYKQVSEFTDVNLLKKLDIANMVEVHGNEWIIISVQTTSPVEVAKGYFDLSCGRARRTII